MREVPDWQVGFVLAMFAAAVALPVGKWLGLGRDANVAAAIACGVLAAVAWALFLRWNERDWQRSIENSARKGL